jgi:pimeloyl-ACP methyl ester carboxylesterase
VSIGDRRLGIAEFGIPDGKLVLWFHGTPGGRRQIPPVARQAAVDLGLRLVTVQRPGSGVSTPHRYRRVADFASDVAVVADTLGHERFAVAGLSGGGPYTLACGAVLPDRVAAIGILGGVCPLVGPDGKGKTSRGLVALTDTFHSVLEPLRPVLAPATRLLYPIAPFGHQAFQLVGRILPEGDRKVFLDPGIEAMFLDDLVEALRGGIGALAHDIALFGADWGFRVGDVKAPVRWWHGDADNFVDLVDAPRPAALLPDVELYVRPGESHLGGFAAADDVLRTLAPFLS